MVTRSMICLSVLHSIHLLQDRKVIVDECMFTWTMGSVDSILVPSLCLVSVPSQQGMGVQDHGSDLRWVHLVTLTMDGVTDIVIGAPYEEESGAVYIYHGDRAGGGFMRDEYAQVCVHCNRCFWLFLFQRILGKQLRSDLHGFGQGISSTTIDVDGNGFNDLLIGSYLSDQVVLLRTKPIVRSVKLAHKFGVEKIDLAFKQCNDLRGNKATCFSFRYTINRETRIPLRGRRIEYGRLLVTLTADSRYPSPIDARAYFNESKEPVLRKIIEPSSNQDPKTNHWRNGHCQEWFER